MEPAEYKQLLLGQLQDSYTDSMPCHLGFRHRTHIVFGEGNPDAEIMFIGEAPGADEDRLGRPFVGRSGQLLTRVLASVDIQRNDIYITNILKCRPPQNRTPLPDEIEQCTQRFLKHQIAIVRPAIIVTLGAIASASLLKETIKITKVHGKHFKKDTMTIIPVYHPAYILRNRSAAEDWVQDFRMIAKLAQQKL